MSTTGLDKETFNQAVTLAAAFVANGDIRCNGNMNTDSAGLSKVHDMITSLYVVIQSAQHHLATVEAENKLPARPVNANTL